MRRGFVDTTTVQDLEVSSDQESINSKAEEFSSEEEESFTYGHIKFKMTIQEIAPVAIHDLKLSHRLSRAAGIDVAALVECFVDESSCWDYRTTKKWIEQQTGVRAI